jgi:hypothetical protein
VPNDVQGFGWCTAALACVQLAPACTLCLCLALRPSVRVGCVSAGALPSQWPRVFTKLQYFFLHSNQFTASSAALPSALPTAWTMPTTPEIFPDLTYLVLYPGNDKLCFLPDGDNNGVGFVDAAPGGKTGWQPLEPFVLCAMLLCRCNVLAMAESALTWPQVCLF